MSICLNTTTAFISVNRLDVWRQCQVSSLFRNDLNNNAKYCSACKYKNVWILFYFSIFSLLNCFSHIFIAHLVISKASYLFPLTSFIRISALLAKSLLITDHKYEKLLICSTSPTQTIIWHLAFICCHLFCLDCVYQTVLPNFWSSSTTPSSKQFLSAWSTSIFSVVT